MADPTWSTLARDDLRLVGDSIVAAEIYQFAMTQLRPDVDDIIEGPLDDYPNVRYRRAIPVSDLEEYQSFTLSEDVDAFSRQAADYMILYRWLTSDEQVNLHRRRGLVVVRIASNVELRKRMGVARR